MEFYNEWIYGKGSEVINELDEQGIISSDMDEDEVFDIVLSKFNKLLNNAVGGDWWEKGQAAGYSEDELNDFYVDNMQAKVDCITDYLY